MDKRAFYRQRHISRNYDQLRFGGLSGDWVNHRELSAVTLLLPPSGKVLDLGCGTGRLSLHLADLGYEVVGLDSSAEMLAIARAKPGSGQVNWLQGDAFALPFTPAAFDAIVALRLAFHIADLRSFLLAIANPVNRRTKRAMTIVLDTYRWSPRALIALRTQKWGGRIFIHRPDQVIREARALGLDLVDGTECFLFSPYVYRKLPLPIVRGLERLEELLPTWFRARVFWRFQSRCHGL